MAGDRGGGAPGSHRGGDRSLSLEPLSAVAAYYRPEYRLSEQILTGGGAGMRMPVKSERDAFRIAYGGALLIVCAVVVGALVGPLLGVLVLVVGGGAALLWDVRTKDPDRRRPLREAADSVRPVADGRRRILVVANETLIGDELRSELAGRGADDTVLRVVAPVLPSRSHYVASDIDRELGDARVRLDEVLAWASERGLVATGRVSDMTPLTAIEDELRSFAADELLISTHPPQRSRWLESGLVERAREELEIPVTHVVVDLARRKATVET
jgi:GABA permease